MKTFDEIKADGAKFFDENFTIGTYNEVEKGLFVSGYIKGYMDSKHTPDPVVEVPFSSNKFKTT